MSKPDPIEDALRGGDLLGHMLAVEFNVPSVGVKRHADRDSLSVTLTVGRWDIGGTFGSKTSYIEIVSAIRELLADSEAS